MSDPQVILFLKSNSLTIYDVVVGEGKSVKFSASEIKHLEVVSKEALKKTLAEFVTDIKPQTAVLLLAEDVLFQKTLDQDEASEEKIAEFFDKIPFAKDQVTHKKIDTKDKVYLFSTNIELYKTIVEVMSESGWEIPDVVPIGVFPEVTTNSTFSTEEVKGILESEAVLKTSNFIDGEEYVVEEKVVNDDDQDQPQGSWLSLKRVVITVCVLIIVGGLVFMAFEFRQQATKPAVPDTVTTVSVVPSPTASASATPAQKQDLTVQILNGSGIAGQASKISAKLGKLGYTNITTGNSPADNQLATQTVYSNRVSVADRDEIKGVLDLSFGQITVSEASSSAQFDITIITGTKASQ